MSAARTVRYNLQNTLSGLIAGDEALENIGYKNRVLNDWDCDSLFGWLANSLLYLSAVMPLRLIFSFLCPHCIYWYTRQRIRRRGRLMEMGVADIVSLGR